MKFETKESGKRIEYPTGMKRDTQEGKPRYDLRYEPLLTEWAELMARGAVKYGESNWQLASTEEELQRFKASAWRHFVQFMRGDKDEAHHAAVLFNVAAIMMLQKKLGHS
jgi:hypothetical protein